MKSSYVTFLAAAGLLATGSTRSYADYTYTTFNVPGSTSTQINGISGTSVFGGYTDATGNHGFIYDGTKPQTDPTAYTTVDVPSAAGGTYGGTSVTGISGNTIVGDYAAPTPGQRYSTANLGFSETDGVFTTITDPLAGNYSTNFNFGTSVTGVSGSTVVGYYYDGLGNGHGFTYTGGVYTAVIDNNPQFPGDTITGTTVSGISGSTLVGVCNETGHGNSDGGFIETGGIFTPLSVFPLAISGQAVVGWGIREVNGTDVHVGIIDTNGVYTYVVDPLATGFSIEQGTELTGIAGTTVVGNYTDSQGNRDAFIATLDSTGPGPTWTGAANGSWDMSATNWTTGIWSNSANRLAPSSAIFALATPATITVNGDIDVGSITFNTGGWILGAGTGVLAFGGTGPINITAATGTDTINAVIADGETFGSGGGLTSLVKSGPGTLILGGANTYFNGTTVNAGVLLVNNTSGSATGVGNVTMNGGALGGSGAIAGNVLDTAGSGPWAIHPSETLSATSATTLTVHGLTTSANTTLNFNLVTPGASSVNDMIIVTGANGLTLSGGVVIFPNHATGAGSLGYYRIVQYSGSIGGAGVGSLLLPAVANNIAYTLDTTHDSGFIDVHRGLLGDGNDDGVVNFADFVLLSNHFGMSGAGWGGGDFNGDGVTNFADFVILSNDFGATIGASEVAGFVAGGATGVPEPGSLVLLGAGMMAVLAWRRGRVGTR